MRFFKPKNESSNLPPRRRYVQPDVNQSELSSGQIFRRNRTLTGSSSIRFRSVNEDQADIKSPRAAAHELLLKKRRLQHQLLIAIGVAGLVFVLLWQLIFSVSAYGRQAVISEPAKYQESIQSYLSKQPLERLRFAVDEARLSAYVVAEHPEVKSVKLAQPSGVASSRFEVEMRRPIVQWRVDAENQYVDDSGAAFKVNYFDSPDIQVVDDSGISSSSGAAVASSRFLGFIGHVVNLSESLGYKVSGITIPAASTRQIEVTYQDMPYRVKYSVDRPAGGQVEDMSRADKYFAGQQIKPEYLDVRVSGRAYYR